MSRRVSVYKGFTIVELLVVIVVIAVLASIAVVAYSGIQERAKVSSIHASLSDVNKTLQLHYAEKGAYPIRSAWVAQGPVTKDTFIPDLVPAYVGSLPLASPLSGGNGTFYYRTDATGAEYKLLYLYPSAVSLPAGVLSNSVVQAHLDPVRPTRGWGYWSSGGSAF